MLNTINGNDPTKPISEKGLTSILKKAIIEYALIREEILRATYDKTLLPKLKKMDGYPDEYLGLTIPPPISDLKEIIERQVDEIASRMSRKIFWKNHQKEDII
jgi:hypothetical protein